MKFAGKAARQNNNIGLEFAARKSGCVPLIGACSDKLAQPA